MKRSRTSKRTVKPRAASPKLAPSAAVKRASIFRNGRNQAVRLPQDMRFAESVKEVRIRKQGDGLLLSPLRPDWASFFALQTQVSEDFLADRHDSPPQSREPL